MSHACDHSSSVIFSFKALFRAGKMVFAGSYSLNEMMVKSEGGGAVTYFLLTLCKSEVFSNAFRKAQFESWDSNFLFFCLA